MVIPDETKTDYTIEEYLELDRLSEMRLEYKRGKIVSLAGGTFNHSVIGTNAATSLSIQLSQKDGDCFAINNDLKIFIQEVDQFRYPDAMVICGNAEMAVNDKSAISNPTLIVEVLSSSTEHLDRGLKFHEYCTLPSFKEYVLIAQDKPIVDTLYREEKGVWKMITTIGLDKSFKLFSLDIDIAMKDIYANTQNLQDPQFRLNF